MKRSSRRARSRPRTVAPPPSAPAADARLRLEGRIRNEGTLTRSTKTDAGLRRRRMRRRAAIALSIFAVLALFALAWSAYAVEVLRVQSGLGTMRGNAQVREVIREPLETEGAVRLAVTYHDDGALSSASLVTIDPDTGRIWAVSVPARAAVPLGKDSVRLDDAYAAGEYHRVIAAVESLTSTEVAGYLDVERSRARELFGGRTAEPGAGLADRVKADLQPMLRTLSETSDSFGRLALGRTARGVVATDLGIRELAAVADAASGADPSTLVIAVPGGGKADGRPVPDPTIARTQAGLLAAGKPLTQDAPATPPPASVTVEVRNGAGLDGVAGDASRILTEAGFKVGPVGNANQFVYKDTLVVYGTDVEAAQDVARRLPQGRVVPARGMYGFDATVLVIVGKDWVEQ